MNCRYFHTDPRGAEVFFKLPEPGRTICYQAFQLALIRYVRRFHAYVPLVLRFIKPGSLAAGRFDVNPEGQGQATMVLKGAQIFSSLMPLVSLDRKSTRLNSS